MKASLEEYFWDAVRGELKVRIETEPLHLKYLISFGSENYKFSHAELVRIAQLFDAALALQ